MDSKRKADEEEEPDEEAEEMPMMPGQKKKRKVRSVFFVALFSPPLMNATQNATAAEARDLAFLRREEERVAEASRFLVPHFSEAQLDRYEAYRRGGFKDAAVRRVVGAVTGAVVHRQAALALRTAAKLFVGDVVEEARSLMDERGESGAVRPWHVREAYARLQEQGKVPVVEPSLMPRAFSAKRNVI